MTMQISPSWVKKKVILTLKNKKNNVAPHISEQAFKENVLTVLKTYSKQANFKN